MVPGKKYAPEDFLAIAWARRWFVFVPFVLFTIGAIVYAMAQPNRYSAKTAIIITPQQVPANFVQSTVTSMLADRLQMIREQVMSRARLERVIEEFNLYPEMRANRIMQDVIEQMRADIDVKITPSRRTDTGSFTVEYSSDNPRTALLVTERLASLFIRENQTDRAVLADATSQFLDAQLEEARRRLLDHEKKLQDYRTRNSGSLPTQVNSNLQGIQTAQMQLQSLQQQSNSDRDRRLFLERSITELKADYGPDAPVSTENGAAQPTTAAAKLEAAREALRGLELRLKPEHPDMQRARRIIADLEKQVDAEELGQPVSAAPVAAPVASRRPTAAERAKQSRIADLQAEIATLDRRLAQRQSDEEKLRANLNTYQARVEAAPVRETELVELMRDYDILKLSYNDLLRKSESSKLAVSLEQRQIGEQFKIVDGARLPEKPISPDRPRIVTMGAAMGLIFGLALVGLLEYRDSSLKTDADVVSALALPVLALIPPMVTKAEERVMARRRRLTAWASLAMLLVAVGAAAWKLELFERWIG